MRVAPAVAQRTATNETTQIAPEKEWTESAGRLGGVRESVRARISWVDRIEYAIRSRGAKLVVLALVANTMVAQLLYNSAGQLVLGDEFLRGYLFFSAICSTVA